MFGENLKYRIEIYLEARKQMEALDKKAQLKVKDAIMGLSVHPPHGNIKKIRSGLDTLRLRAGNYRILLNMTTPTGG